MSPIGIITVATVLLVSGSGSPPFWVQRELCTGLWDQAQRTERFQAQLTYCLRLEERSQLYLQWYWTQIPEKVQEDCIRENRRPSYFSLARCVALRSRDPAISNAAPGPTGE